MRPSKSKHQMGYQPISGRVPFFIYRKLSVCFLILIFFTACNISHEEIRQVDFTKLSEDSLYEDSADSVNPVRVAVAAIISPSESFIYYEELFDYISAKIKRPVHFLQRKTYAETNELLTSRSVDIAFICSGAYIANKENCELLVVPVCNGLPYYQAYIIVNANSNTGSFAGLQGKNFAFSDPLSNTGKLYPECRVKELFNLTPDEFFSKIIYTNAHDISMQLVSKNVVDGASIDGLIYEYIREKTPSKVENIKIIERSEYFGIPPVVCSKWIDPELKLQLKKVFLEINNDSAGSKILNELMIDRFIDASDTLYDKVILMHGQVKQ